jgi:uncharacterized OsmC-like protein
MNATIEQSIQLWAKDAEKAMASPTVGAQSDGAQAVLTAGPFSLQTDLPLVLGGENKAISPIALMLSALSGCAAVLIRDTLAPQLGVRVDSVKAAASCKVDYRGLLGMPGAEADMQDLAITITIQSPDSDEKVQSLYEAWLERCPVYLSLIKPLSVRTSLDRTSSEH